jgi:hypothetical protein
MKYEEQLYTDHRNVNQVYKLYASAPDSVLTNSYDAGEECRS